MKDLKPCPFCGSKAEVYVDERGISIKCTCCFAETEPDRDVIKSFEDKKYWSGGWNAFNSAVEKWNKRERID